MSQDDVEAVARGYYEARLANDPAKCLEFLGAGTRIRIAGAPETNPIATDAQDVAAVKASVEELVGVFQWQSMDIRALLVDGDTAAVHYDLTATYVPTGSTESTEIVDIVRVADGQIASITEFVDTALVAKMMGE